jgi:hypothetical protein
MALDFHSNDTTLISPSHPSEISKTNRAPLRTLDARMAALVAGVWSMCNASAAKPMMTIWPITAKTEFADREVTELFKIRYTPLNPSCGVDRAQYHALQMATKPGEEEGTTIKKTVLLERLNPKWMAERFDLKFLRMV